MNYSNTAAASSSPLEGGLLIDKPQGITSHDVVARVRRLLRIKRVGHTGTLDPMATGLLVLLLGRATRFSQFLLPCDKEYVAGVQLGIATDTYDATGTPGPGNFGATRAPEDVTIAEVESALDRFRGEIEQTPPMFSAKKRAGIPLYRLARKGVEVERPAVRVTIRELELQRIEHVSVAPLLRVRVRCSSGTYIRSLAHDLGLALGCGAHLASLRRTSAGGFNVSAACSLDEFESLAGAHDVASCLVPFRELLGGMPAIVIAGDQLHRVMHGASIKSAAVSLREGELCQILDGGGRLLAIAFRGEEKRELMPRVVMTDT